MTTKEAQAWLTDRSVRTREGNSVVLIGDAFKALELLEKSLPDGELNTENPVTVELRRRALELLAAPSVIPTRAEPAPCPYMRLEPCEEEKSLSD